MSKTEMPSIRFYGFDNDWEQRKFDEAFIERQNKTEKENEDILLLVPITYAVPKHRQTHENE